MRDVLCLVLTISIFFISLSFITAIFSETELGKRVANFLIKKAELLKAQKNFMYLEMEANDVLITFYEAIANFNSGIIPSDWLVIAQRAEKALKNSYKETVDAVYVRKINNFLIVKWRCKKK